MKIKKTSINDCYIIFPEKKIDNRGSFHRSFCEKTLKKKGINFKIKQCNISINKKKNTFRGFHYQIKPYTENKIINVISGSITNITIDLRKKSKSYLKKAYNKIDSKDNYSILIPAGCANAFFTLENNTVIHYYMSAIFEDQNKSKYQGFRYNDPFFKVKLNDTPRVLSKQDISFENFKIENLK